MKKDLPLFGRHITAAALLLPIGGALLLGVLWLTVAPRLNVGGIAFALAWLWIGFLGASAFHVLRSVEKRLSALERERDHAGNEGG